MFKIHFLILDNDVIPANTPMIDIRYFYCVGNVWFTFGDKRISMDWGWVPLIDFALSMKQILNSFNNHSTYVEVFDFTENDDTITYSKNGETVSLMFSFTQEEFVIPWPAFKKGAEEFIEELRKSIKQPGL